MRVLSLFSGIGAHDFGLEMAQMQIVGQCEIDPFCNLILEKLWPQTPRWRDVRDVAADDVRARCGRIDLICGGVPCQPASIAGRRKGSSDDRWLWPAYLRVVREVKPMWLLAENVCGIITLRPHGLDWIIGELDTAGYEIISVTCGAEHFGAPHRRHRVWIVGRRVADSDISNDSEQVGSVCWRKPDSGGACETVADATGQRERESAIESLAITVGGQTRTQFGDGRKHRWPARPGQPQHDWEDPRLIEFQVGGEPDGIAKELVRVIVDRTGWTDAEAQAWWKRNKVKADRLNNRLALKAIGNANPPQVVAAIGRAIMAASKI